MTINPPTQTTCHPNGPRGRVLLLRLEEPIAKKCQSAASALSLDSFRIESLGEARQSSDGASPICLITPNDTVSLRVLQNPNELVFRRMTTVIIEENTAMVERYRNLGQFAISPSATRETLQAEIDSAILQAGDRQWKWNTIEDFQRRLDRLTPEEYVVLEVVCLGNLNKQIAKQVGVSVRTIEQRRRRVFDKMEVDSAVTLAAQLATVKALLHPLHRTDSPHDQVPSSPVINLTSALSNPAHASSRQIH